MCSPPPRPIPNGSIIRYPLPLTHRTLLLLLHLLCSYYLCYFQSTSGGTPETGNYTAADGAASSKIANDNRGESDPPLKSSSELRTPPIGENSIISEEANPAESGSESASESRRRKYLANSDDLSESSLIIDEDWDGENDATSNPVFESPKQNGVPQGHATDEAISPPPAKMARVAAKSPKSQPSEQDGSKGSSKKPSVNKRTGSSSGGNSVGRPKGATSVANGKTVSNANQTTKNNAVPSANKTTHKSHCNSTPPAKGGSNASSRSLSNGTASSRGTNNNPPPKSNPGANGNNPNCAPKRTGSTDGSCNHSDQENNGTELLHQQATGGGKQSPDAPPTPRQGQGLLQPQNNNHHPFAAASRPNSVLDQIMITDVTANLVTVTVLECSTSDGFFRDRDPAAAGH